jgi:hypothetical protein
MSYLMVIVAAHLGLSPLPAFGQTRGVPDEDDQTAATEIEHRLSADRTVNAQNVTIYVKDGVATLSGRVPAEDAKRRAEEIASSVHGVTRVRNEISAAAGGLEGDGEPGPIPERAPGVE